MAMDFEKAVKEMDSKKPVSTQNVSLDTQTLNYCHKCQLCDAVFAVRSDLDSHIDEGHDAFDEVFKHSESELSMEPEYTVEDICVRSCPICNQLLGSEDGFKRHLINYHLKAKHIGKRVSVTNTRKEEKERQSWIETNDHGSLFDEEKLQFECHLCKKSYSNKTSFQGHMYSHSKHTMYRCPFCPDPFSLPSDLRKHIKTVHAKKSLENIDFEALKFDLAILAKSVGIDVDGAKGINQTVNVADLISDYKCPHCPNAIYTWFSVLRKHMEDVHSVKARGIKPEDYRVQHGLLKCRNSVPQPQKKEQEQEYSCDICGLTTASLSTLKQHIHTAHFPKIEDGELIEDFLEEAKDESVESGNEDQSELDKAKKQLKAIQQKESSSSCNKRGTSAATLKKLKDKVRSKKLKSMKYKCLDCEDMEFPDWNSLTRHFKEKHSDESESELTERKCEMFPKESAQKRKNIEKKKTSSDISNVLAGDKRVQGPSNIDRYLCIYNCPHCEDTSYPMFFSLKCHIKDKHPDEPHMKTADDCRVDCVGESNQLETADDCHVGILQDASLEAEQEIQKRAYKCPFCDDSCYSLFQNLRDHVEVNHSAQSFDNVRPEDCRIHFFLASSDKYMYKCPHCDDSVHSSLIALKNHVREEHDLELMEGQIEENCVRKEDTIENLVNDGNCIKKKDHQPVCKQRYQCPYCECQVNYFGSLKRHIIRRHPERSNEDLRGDDHLIEVSDGEIEVDESSGQVKYHCPYCEFQLAQISSIKRHVRRKHPEISVADLEQANIIVTSKGFEMELSKIKYRCPVCSCEVLNLNSIKRHIRDKHPEIAFASLKVEDVMIMSGDNMAVKKNKYLCPHCNCEFMLLSSLKMHVGEKHPEISIDSLKVKDEITCLMAESDNEAVKKNLYSCLYCECKVRLHSSLRRHIRNKHPNVPLENLGPEEGKSSGRDAEPSVTVKDQITSGDQMAESDNEAVKKNLYSCSYCDCKVTLLSSLSRHIRNKHPNEPLENLGLEEGKSFERDVELSASKSVKKDLHVCPYCDCKVKFSSGLRRHIRKEHSNMPVEIPNVKDNPTTGRQDRKLIDKSGKPTKTQIKESNLDEEENIILTTEDEGDDQNIELVETEDGPAETRKKQIEVSIMSNALELDEEESVPLNTEDWVDDNEAYWNSKEIDRKCGPSNSLETEDGLPKYKCTDCDFKAIFFSNLKLHLSKKHPEVTANKVEPETFCIGMDKISSTGHTSGAVEKDQSDLGQKSKLDNNMADNVIYQCSVCDRVFMLLSSLKRHMKTKHIQMLVESSVPGTASLADADQEADNIATKTDETRLQSAAVQGSKRKRGNSMITVFPKKKLKSEVDPATVKNQRLGSICSVCGKEFRRVSSLKFHLEHSHKRKKDVEVFVMNKVDRGKVANNSGQFSGLKSDRSVSKTKVNKSLDRQEEPEIKRSRKVETEMALDDNSHDGSDDESEAAFIDDDDDDWRPDESEEYKSDREEQESKQELKRKMSLKVAIGKSLPHLQRKKSSKSVSHLQTKKKSLKLLSGSQAKKKSATKVANKLTEYAGADDIYSVYPSLKTSALFPFQLGNDYEVMKETRTDVKMYCCAYCDMKSGQSYGIKKHIARAHKAQADAGENQKDIAYENNSQKLKDNESKAQTGDEVQRTIVGKELGTDSSLVKNAEVSEAGKESEDVDSLDENAKVVSNAETQHTGLAGKVGEDFHVVLDNDRKDKFQCLHCDFISESIFQSTMRRHIYRFHLEKVAPDSIGVRVAKPNNVSRAGTEGRDFVVVTSDTGQVTYICLHCSQICTWRSSIRQHIYRWHVKVRKRAEDGPRKGEPGYVGQAGVKGKDFTQETDADGKYYQCCYCEQRSKHYTSIRKHMWRFHRVDEPNNSDREGQGAMGNILGAETENQSGSVADSVQFGTDEVSSALETVVSVSETLVSDVKAKLSDDVVLGKDYKEVISNEQIGYKCLHCSKIENEEKIVRKHIVSEHLSPVQSGPRIESESIDRVAGSVDKDFTIVKEDKEIMSFHCLLCDTILSSCNLLKQHMYRVHTDRIGGDSLGQQKLESIISKPTEETGISDDSETIQDKMLTDSAGAENRTSEVTKQTQQNPASTKTQYFLSRRQRLDLMRRSRPCRYCDKICYSIAEMRFHMRHVHKDSYPRDFVCELCGAAYIEKYSLNIHHRIKHSGLAPAFECNQCEKKFHRNSALLSHIRRAHSERVICDICGLSLKNKHTLASHMLSKHKDQQSLVDLSGSFQTHYCDLCGVEFSHRKGYREHQRKLHSESRALRESCRCNFCDMTCDNKKHLQQHVRKEHFNMSDEKVVDEGSEETVSDDVKSGPGKRGQKGNNTVKGSRLFLPPSTIVESASLAPYRVVRKPWSKQVACKLCGKEFSGVKLCNVHIRRRHIRSEDKPFRCKICGRGFILFREFEIHSRVHTNARPYKCSLCQATFKQNNHRQEHMKLHKRAKEYWCALCNYRSNTNGGLYAHLYKHCRIKPFKCPFCAKSWSDRGTLTRHMVIYTSDKKSLPCHICFEEFKCNAQVQKHLKESHELENFFICEVCGQACPSYLSLYNHKKKSSHFTAEDYKTRQPETEVDQKHLETDQSVQQIVQINQSETRTVQNVDTFSIDDTDNVNTTPSVTSTLYSHDSRVTIPETFTANIDDVSSVLTIASEETTDTATVLLDLAQHLSQMSSESPKKVNTTKDDKPNVVVNPSPTVSQDIVVNPGQTVSQDIVVNPGQTVFQNVALNPSQGVPQDVVVNTSQTVSQNDVVNPSQTMSLNNSTAAVSTDFLDLLDSDQEVLSALLQKRPHLTNNLSPLKAAKDHNEGTVEKVPTASVEEVVISNSDVKPLPNMVPTSRRVLFFQGDTLFVFEDEPEIETTMSATIDSGDQAVIDTATGIEKENQLQNYVQIEKDHQQEQRYIACPIENAASKSTMVLRPNVERQSFAGESLKTTVMDKEESDSDYIPYDDDDDDDDNDDNTKYTCISIDHNATGYTNQTIPAKEYIVKESNVPRYRPKQQIAIAYEEKILDGKHILKRKDSHSKMSRSADRTFRCTHCSKYYTNAKYLKRHMVIHDPNRVRDKICHYCNKAFPRNNELLRHLRTHTDERPYPCDICGKSFRQSVHLIEHQRIHAGELPFKCAECGDNFRNEAGLRAHVQRKHTKVRYSCNVCGAGGFKSETAMQRHKVSVHTNLIENSRVSKQMPESPLEVKEFQCDKCPKSYSKKNGLTKHLKTHLTGNDFICDQCGKGFASQSHLKSHVYDRHTRQRDRGGRRQSCYICGIQTKSMSSHLKTHDDTVKFSCQLCGKQYRSANSFRSHIAVCASRHDPSL